jgi:RHS repeat-associated protein
LAEYAAGAIPTNPTRSYVYGSYIDDPLLLKAGSSKFYYHHNEQFSTHALTNNSGAPYERYRYTAYGLATILAPDGVTVRATSSASNAITFAGRRLDTDTALYYYRARYYDSNQGRFISRDASQDNRNLYLYVQDDPYVTCPQGWNQFLS